MMNEFRKKIRARLTGESEKKQIAHVQMISSYLFLPMGLVFFYLRNFPLGMMFCSEALGQFFMARDNQRTLAQGDPMFRYLPASTLGRISSICFAVTAFSRFFMTGYLLTGIVFAGMMILAAFLYRRPEESGAMILTISALVLGIWSLNESAFILSAFQLLYAILLVTGLAFFRASRAEVINIVLWTGFFLSFLASPQT